MAERDRAVDEARGRLALDDYASDLNRLRNSQEQAKEAVKPYNDAISGIAEPIGASGLGALAKKYIEKAVKKGVNKAVGRLATGARSTLEDVRNGADPLEALRNGARNTVDGVRSSITETTGDLQQNLTARGQQIVNRARRLAGRSTLRPSATIDDRPPPNVSFTEDSNPAPTPQSASDSTASAPAEAEPRAVNLTAESTATAEDADLVSAVTGSRMSIGEAMLRKSARSVPVPSARDVPTPTSATAGPASDVPTPASAVPTPTSATAGPGDNTPPASSQPSDGGTSQTGFREGEGPQIPNQPTNAESQQSRMRIRMNGLGNDPSGTESADASIPNTDTTPASDTTTPASDTPSPAVPATEEGSLLSDAGEAELAGGGPEDPFSDIVAGILSLGAIIAGATAKVKPKTVNGDIVNPSVQYGI